MFKKTFLIFALIVSPVFADYTETVVLTTPYVNGDTYIKYNSTTPYGGYASLQATSYPAIPLIRFNMGSLSRTPLAARVVFQKDSGTVYSTFKLCTTDGTWTDTSTYSNYHSKINLSTTVHSSINFSGSTITIPLNESYITADYAFVATATSNLIVYEHPTLELDYSTSVVGDSNFDGTFDSADLVQVLQLGKYESGLQDATWSSGDWNGDGYFNSSDFVTAFQASTYEDGAEALANEVETNF